MLLLCILPGYFSVSHSTDGHYTITHVYTVARVSADEFYHALVRLSLITSIVAA